MTGRGNIFVLFLYKCLTQHLKTNGILAFVLPTSLYNCTYYEPCRKYIKENCEILFLQNINVSYYDTNQDTMILIIRNKKLPEPGNPVLGTGNHKFIFETNDCIYFTPYYKELNKLVENSTTLSELGFIVKTGEVVWNEHKEILTDDEEEGTLLIYTSNIDKENKLVLNNLKGEKKQYIKVGKDGINKKPIKGAALLISRGYGNKYKLSYTEVEEGVEFFGENHINVIYKREGEDIKEQIEKIKKSLESENTNKFIKWFVGNGALSKTEIENVLPIF